MQIRAPSVPTHSVGALHRKRRTWPPPCMKEPPAASRLTPRHWLQPALWYSAQGVCLLIAWMIVETSCPAYAQDMDTIGAGTLIFRHTTQESIEAPRVHTEVNMEVSGVIARVEVRQRFQNPGDQWVEGLYAFPLPENAAVDRLRMQIGERVVVGEIREKIAAQKLYEQARNNGQRASVVHQQRPNLFRTAVANIGPHETISITLAYLQIVDQHAGRYSLRFPLTITPRYIPGVRLEEGATLTAQTPATSLSHTADPHDAASVGDLQPALAHSDKSRQSVTFSISLDAGVAIENMSSAWHAISIVEQEGRYHVGLSDETIAPDHDFELAWTPGVHNGPATALFRERTEAGEHVLLMFMPPQERIRIETPREVIFVIDTSGSMGGQSMEQARAALLNGLATLRPTDRFNLIQFNSTVDMLFDFTVDATVERLEQARQYVRRLYSTGGTEMLPALSAALSMPGHGEYLRQILFITDGAVSNEDELTRLIHERLGEARLFTVGIGSAPNGHFMRKAAQMGLGTFTFIGSTNEVDQRMSELLHKLTQPVLTDIELRWPHDITPEYAPAQVGDLYADEPIIVSARLQGRVEGLLNISGRSGGVWTRQLVLDQAESRPGAATLWARNRISDLMDTKAHGAVESTIREQVLPLALQYQLVTQYTSLVAVDRTPARSDGESVKSTRIENTRPSGSDWAASGYPATATPAGLQLLSGALALLLAAASLVRKPARNRVTAKGIRRAEKECE